MSNPGANASKETVSAEEARRFGSEIGIDWATAPFAVEQFRMGMEVSSSTADTIRRPTSLTTTRF